MFSPKCKRSVTWAPLIVAASLCSITSAHASFVDTTPDGAKYTLSWMNNLSVYTFKYVADFTGYTGSAAIDNDYALAISIASVPGSVDWTAGSIAAAPGTESNWSINQGVVANSSGCPSSGGAGKDWCIGLSSPSNDGPLITTSSILTWEFSMTLTAGTPNFSGSPGNEWSYKFVTTDGTYGNDGWNFGNYQVSRKYSGTGPDPDPDPNPVPVPGTLALFSLGLLGLGAIRRRRLA